MSEKPRGFGATATADDLESAIGSELYDAAGNFLGVLVMGRDQRTLVIRNPDTNRQTQFRPGRYFTSFGGVNVREIALDSRGGITSDNPLSEADLKRLSGESEGGSGSTRRSQAEEEALAEHAAQLEIAIGAARAKEDRETELLLLDERRKIDVDRDKVAQAFQKEQNKLDRENQERMSLANEVGALRRQNIDTQGRAKELLSGLVGDDPFRSAAALQGGVLVGNTPADVLKSNLTETAFGTPPGLNVDPYKAPLPEVRQAVTGLQEQRPLPTVGPGATAFGLAGGGEVEISQDALTPNTSGPTGVGILVGERAPEVVEVTDQGFRVIPLATRGAGGLDVKLPGAKMPTFKTPTITPPRTGGPTPVARPPAAVTPFKPATPTPITEPGLEVPSYTVPSQFQGTPFGDYLKQQGGVSPGYQYGDFTTPQRSTLPGGQPPENDPNWNPALTSREDYLAFQAQEDAIAAAVAGGFNQDQRFGALPYTPGSPFESLNPTPASLGGNYEDYVRINTGPNSAAALFPEKAAAYRAATTKNDRYEALFGAGTPYGVSAPITEGDPFGIRARTGLREPGFGTPPPVDAGQGIDEAAGGGVAGGQPGGTPPAGLPEYVGSLFGKLTIQEILRINQLAQAGDASALTTYLGTLFGKLTAAEIQGILGRFQTPGAAPGVPPAAPPAATPPGTPPAAPPGTPPSAGVTPPVLSSGLSLADYMAQLFPNYASLDSSNAAVIQQFAALPGLHPTVKAVLDKLASDILAVGEGTISSDVLRVDLSNLSQAYLKAYGNAAPPIGTPPPGAAPPGGPPAGGPGSPEAQIGFLNALVAKWPNVTAQDVRDAADAGLQNVAQILWDFFAAGGPQSQQAKDAAYLKLLEVAPGIQPAQNPYGPQVTPQAMASAISLLWQHLGLSQPPTTELGALGSPGFGQGVSQQYPSEAFSALGLAPKLFRNSATGQVFVNDGAKMHAITSSGAASVGELAFLGFHPGDIVSLPPGQLQNISDPWLLGQKGNYQKVLSILQPQSGVPYPTLTTPQREPVTGLLLPEPRLIASVLPQLPPSVQDLILSAYQAAGTYNPASASAEINFFTPRGADSAASVGFTG